MDQDIRNDRRRPRVEVQHLRRDLRDADQDRYRLTSQLEQQQRGRSSSSHLLGAMIFIAGGLTSALWLTLPVSPRVAQAPPGLPTGATVPEQVADSAVTRDYVLPVESLAVEAPPMSRVSPRQVQRGAGLTRSRTAGASANAPTRAREVEQVEREIQRAAASRSRGDEVHDARRDAGDAQIPRRRPRPLSPGEFGRPATL